MLVDRKTSNVKWDGRLPTSMYPSSIDSRVRECSEGEVLLVNAMLHDEFGLIYLGSFEDIMHEIWKQTTITDVEVLLVP